LGSYNSPVLLSDDPTAPTRAVLGFAVSGVTTAAAESVSGVLLASVRSGDFYVRLKCAWTRQ